MQFNNRENECVGTVDGRRVFLSRSVAVIPVVICSLSKPGPGQDYVLVNKRGPACPDHVGKWTLPCGYLDWDESGSEAAIREIWEECGFNATDIEKYGIVDRRLLKDIPWEVTSAPSEDPRQNVLLHYSLHIVSEDTLPPVRVGPDKGNEVSEVKWMPVFEAMGQEMAFGHHHRIAKYLDSVSIKK